MGLLLLFACASSPEPEPLEWHAVVPERDTIPYVVDASGTEGSTPPPVAPSAASLPPESEVIVAAVEAVETIAEPPATTAVTPTDSSLPVSSVDVPPPLEEQITVRTAATAPPASAAQKSPAPLPGEMIVDLEEPEALPLPLEPAHTDEEMDNEHLVPTGEREELEVVRDSEPEAAPVPAERPASPGQSVPAEQKFTPKPVPAEIADPEPDMPEVWNDSVVARVNGAPILFSELKEFALDQNLPLMGLTADGMQGDGFRRAMTARVDQTLLVQAAHLESLEPDQLEVARRVDAFIAQRVDEAGGRAQFIEALRSAQLNLDSFRDLLIKRESQRQLASGIVSRRVTISSSELEAFKQQRMEAGEPLEQVQLAQILVKCPASEQGTTLGDEQFRRALEIATRAGRQPAAFSKIITEINSDPTGRERGGLLGWIDPASLQPSIAEVVKTLHPGEVSEPVASDAGYHVLFLLERRDARDMLYSRKFDEERNKLIEELRSKAQIEIYPIEGAG